MEWVKGVEPSSKEWKSFILAVVLYPHFKFLVAEIFEGFEPSLFNFSRIKNLSNIKELLYATNYNDGGDTQTRTVTSQECKSYILTS